MALEKEWYIHEANDSEEDILHRPANEEYAFYNAVSHGDIETVRQNCESNRFTDLEGWMNQYVAKKADEVILMVSGISVRIKN